MLGLGDGANATHSQHHSGQSVAGYMALNYWIGQLLNRLLQSCSEGYMLGGSTQHTLIHLSFCNIFIATMKLEAEIQAEDKGEWCSLDECGQQKNECSGDWKGAKVVVA